MLKITAQILQLLPDPATHYPGTRPAPFGNCQVGFSRLLTIRPRFLFQFSPGIQFVDDLFTELSCLIQQTQVGGIANRLFANGGIQDQLSLMLRLLL